MRSFKWTMFVLDGCTSRSSSRFYTYTFTFFKIYINDLPDNLTSNPKLLAGDTSLFSTVTDPNATTKQINNDSHNISKYGQQCKMNFNLDTSKQAQEVIFSRKVKITAYPQLVFSNNPVH